MREETIRLFLFPSFELPPIVFFICSFRFVYKLFPLFLHILFIRVIQLGEGPCVVRG